MNIAINNTLYFNNSETNTFCLSNLESTNYFIDLEINNLYGLKELLQKTKEYTIEKAKDISQILIEIYLELYKIRTLYNSIDNIYHQSVCDKKQEKTITYEQKIKTIYDFYLDKFKKNTKISEVESRLLSSYRDKIDWIKYNIPRAKQDSLNFFYSIYALNELLNFYFDDYLGLTEFLEPSSNIAKLGEELYIENEKLGVI